MAQKAFSPVVNPSIVLGTLKVFKDTDIKLNKIVATISADRSKAINQVLDAMIIAADTPKPVFMKGNSATNAARFQVKGMFDAIVEAGHLEKSTAASYQTCFWIAFERGIAWSPDLANKKTEEKKKGEAEAEGEAKPTTTAKTKVITLEEAQRSFSVALAQLRAVYQAELASELLDVMLERFPEFKESTVK
jgi:hypothetical protein